MRRVLMIVAGCICNIIISAVFGAFGAHVPYFLSYLRIANPTLKYSDIALLVALNNVAFNTLSWCSGFMIRSLGVRVTATLASVFLSISTASCYVGVSNYWAFVILTSSVAFFSAIIQASVIVICMEWGKRHKGMAIGIISFSESIGSTLFSILGTVAINPHNLPTNTYDEDGNGYFGQPEILERIPFYFVGLGIVSLLTLLPTSLFIQMPPPQDEEVEFLVEESDEIAYVRSVRSLNCDLSHASIPDYRRYLQTVRTISQTSYKTKPSIIIDEEPSFDKDDDGISVDSVDDCHWSRIFTMSDFYVITIVYSATKICRTILSTFYKAYGLTVIKNDQFLTTIAVLSNFSNAFGRLLWGGLSDKIRSKYLIILASLLGVVGVEATYYSLFSPYFPHIMYMITICLDGVIFASQILFTTCLYTYFGKKDFAIKYGLVRAGPGLAVLGFSFLMKYVEIFEEWRVVYHSMSIICVASAIVSFGLKSQRVTAIE